MSRIRTEGDGLPDVLRGVRFRAALIALILVAGLALVFGRAVHLQVLQQERLGSLARNQYARTVELTGRRGEIRDRLDGPLASSVEVDSIYVDPGMVASDEAGRRAAVEKLSKAAGLSKDRSGRLMSRALRPGNRFEWVKRRASPAAVAAVKSLGIEGVGLVKESRRFYPQKELASQLLGFSGADGKGLEGLERYLDDELSGQGARVRGLRDARGRALLDEESVPVDRRSGATVNLTLDRTVQYLAEKALAQAVADANAVAGTVVVLDPRTGEVLAMASVPTFNPNVVPRAEQKDTVRNRAITDSYEPGSTMKTFLLAGALEAGAIRPNQRFDCENGAWRVGRHTIHDHERYGYLTPEEILRVSSNVCSGKVGLAVGGPKVAELYRAFGFGAKTGIDLPGEINGVVGSMKRDIEIVTASFGQGPITSTPLQLAAALGAIANGGTLMRPYLVKSVTEPDGTVSRQGAPYAVRRVISPETARTVTRWMEAVVSKAGTAERAAIDGYPVAGKTGTSQKVARSGGYGRARIASFGGFVPADDPRLVVLVVIDEPKGRIYGGQVAAPAFREIAAGALKVLGIPPTRPLARKSEPPAGRAAPVTAPEEPVIAEGWVEADDDAPAEPGAVRVPDVRGLFARTAVRRVADAALEAELDGTGKVVGQEPPAGSFVRPGSRVTIRLQPL